MRDLILKMSVSIDGFVGGPNHESDFIFADIDDQQTAWTIDVISHAGLHIMGSKTFKDMASFWPTSTEAYAPPMNTIPKAVFTKQGPSILKAGDTSKPGEGALAFAGKKDHADHLQPGAETWAQAYVAGGDLAEEIAKLKAQEGGPIIAHGGAGFARSLIAAGLPDEYDLLVHPYALGQGLPIFTDLAKPRALKLVSSTAFPKGSVAQVYRPA